MPSPFGYTSENDALQYTEYVQLYYVREGCHCCCGVVVRGGIAIPLRIEKGFVRFVMCLVFPSMVWVSRGGPVELYRTKNMDMCTECLFQRLFLLVCCFKTNRKAFYFSFLEQYLQIICLQDRNSLACAHGPGDRPNSDSILATFTCLFEFFSRLSHEEVDLVGSCWWRWRDGEQIDSCPTAAARIKKWRTKSSGRATRTKYNIHSSTEYRTG